MRCVVFELAGGGTYVPPPGRAKVAQTPGRARVKRGKGVVAQARLVILNVYSFFLWRQG